MAAFVAGSLGTPPGAAARAAALVSATEPTVDLETEALELEDRGDLRGAARLWQTLAVRAEDGETRSMAAFRALEARRALGATTGAITEFCAAARIIAWTLDREDLLAETRAEFEGFAREVEAEIAAHGGRGGCSAAESEVRTEWGAPPETDEREAADSKSSSRTPRPARRFLIAGAVTTSAGLALVGLMGYGLAIDHASADVVYELAAKNEEVGLTTTEAAELDEAVSRGRAGARLALGSGIAAGVVGLAGVGLLAHGGRLTRTERLTVAPRIGGGLVGLSLGGRF